MAALALHTAHYSKEHYIHDRISRAIIVQDAARSLNIFLTLSRFEPDEWEFKEWLVVQSSAVRQG